MAVELLRYEKLAAELQAMIDGGVLACGERLPSVRRLAGARRLSVSTVVQAFRQLEERGVVEARPQSGYFVRRAAFPCAEPTARSTPETAVAVDVSQRLVRVLQAGQRPGVAPLAAALPAPSLLPLAALQRLYAGVARRHAGLLAGGAISTWTSRCWFVSWYVAHWPGVGRWRARRSSSPIHVPKRSVCVCGR